MSHVRMSFDSFMCVLSLTYVIEAYRMNELPYIYECTHSMCVMTWHHSFMYMHMYIYICMCMCVCVCVCVRERLYICNMNELCHTYE